VDLFLTKIVLVFNDTLTEMKETCIYNSTMLPSDPLVTCYSIQLKDHFYQHQQNHVILKHNNKSLLRLDSRESIFNVAVCALIVSCYRPGSLLVKRF